MRRKASELKSDEDQYGYRPFQAAEKRLDLNDLLNQLSLFNAL